MIRPITECAMAFVALGCVTARAASPVAVPAAFPGDTSADVSLALRSARPLVLPGIALGVAAEGHVKPLVSGAFYTYVRLAWSEVGAANVSWRIDHHEFMATAGVGLASDLGAGTLFGSLGLGLSGIYERLSRHQRERIEAAGVSGAIRDSVTIGPAGEAEVGLRLRLTEQVGALLAGGPELRAARVNDTWHWRLGGAARLGCSYVF